MAKTDPKSVLLILGDSADPQKDLYAAGSQTFLSQLLELAGGKNVIENPMAEYPKVSKEFIIQKSPEVIIEAGPKSNLSAKEKNARLNQWNLFTSIRAVKNKNIHFIGADYILIPGPRLLKIIERFAKAIHPESFQ